MMQVCQQIPTLCNSQNRTAVSPTEKPICVYGDPAYLLRVQLQAPFRQANLTPIVAQYNSDMSSVMITVELLFGDILNDFTFFVFKKELDDWNEQHWKNVPCLYTSKKFTDMFVQKQYLGLDPPALQTYFM